jgi:TRAP-type mannitol/chloroaromatic compound transport system permease large subunit
MKVRLVIRDTPLSSTPAYWLDRKCGCGYQDATQARLQGKKLCVTSPAPRDVWMDVLEALPGGVIGAVIVVMPVMFLLGFVLDFIQITFVVVPIVGPVLLAMGFDPVWLGIMIAINLQTSFLTPPFGFALFYLRGVAPPSVTTAQIYRGAIPFVAIQVFALLLLAVFPELVTWLSGKIYGQ